MSRYQWRSVPLCLALVNPLAAVERSTLRECGPLLLEEAAGRAGIDFRHDRGTTDAKHLPETMGGGLAWIDYDLDGYLDLYLVQSGPFPPDRGAAAANRLFRNLGDGTFEDVTERSASGDQGCGQGAVAGDVDGDGDSDLYVTNFGADVLLINDGAGRFADKTGSAGLGLEGWSSSAALADADLDGDLDLYVSRYVEYDPGAEIFCGDAATGERSYCDPSIFQGAGDRFYRNLGSGRFDDASDAAGILPAAGRGLGVVFVDLDDDGGPDLYVANDLDINQLFRNRLDGTFEDLSLVSGIGVNRDGRPEAGMGLAVGDVDGDRDPDLAVTNFDVETNTLYRNLGGLSFEDVSTVSGFGLPSFNQLAFGLAAIDLDHDSDLDFYITNGHIFERPKRDNVFYRQRDQVLLGDGSGHFAELRCAFLDDNPTTGRGLAVADFDNDGDVDLGLLENGGPFRLLTDRNNGEAWVGVRLQGTDGNTWGIGGRVEVAAGETTQRRWILAGDSYQSSSDPRALVAVPPAIERVDLSVRWPSGRRQRFIALETGRYLQLWERSSRGPG